MNSRTYAFVMTGLSFVGLAVAIYVMSFQSARNGTLQVEMEKTLPVLGQLSDFSLTNQNNQSFGLEDLDGKYWVADFIFTTCSGICPVMSNHMAEIRNAFRGESQLNFVSISVDPDTDTPEVLMDYASSYDAGDRWHFLTGETESVQSLAVQGFKIGNGNDPLNHSPYFVLVDPKGQIRGYYNGTETDEVEEITADVRALLANSL